MSHPHRPETAPLSPSEAITAEHLLESALKLPEVAPARITAEELIERAQRIPSVRPDPPTFYRDETPPQPTGALPVRQDDPSVWGHVPKWALGAAVGGPALGVTTIGVGYGASLFFGSVTTEGIVMVGVIAGGAVTFVGSLYALVKRLGTAAASAPAPVTNHFAGDVRIQKTTLVNNTGGPLSFQRNKITSNGDS